MNTPDHNYIWLPLAPQGWRWVNLHRENTCRGVCDRCDRWCEGTRSKTLDDGTRQPEDRLKTLRGHRLCDTCKHAWDRRTDTLTSIDDWITVRRIEFRHTTQRVDDGTED